jgi:hypothetical protein
VRADRIGLDFVQYTFELLFFMQTSSCPVSKFWLMGQVEAGGFRTGRIASRYSGFERRAQSAGQFPPYQGAAARRFGTETPAIF